MIKKSNITRFVTRSGLKIKKNSPQILFTAGIVGTVATTVLASRATLKAVPVLEELRSNRAELDVFQASSEVDADTYTQEVVRQYTVASVQLIRLYAPAVIVGTGSVVCLTKSHRILTSRNTAINAAYTGLFNTFNKYRERVREDLGDERDQQFLHGTITQEIDVTGKNGKTSTKSITTLDSSSAAALTFMYDENCASWVPDPGYNQTTIDGVQSWSNVLLQRQGHLFLNEVYDQLYIPHTKEGAILGWVFDDLGNNDNFVSLGHERDGEFLAGYKRDVMLEFNIHGPILDLI